MKEILKYQNCFVCGDKNPTGLQAKFYYDGQKAVSEVIALDKFEGYNGIYHGGIISTILDEVMIKAILAVDIYVVTAEITVRFKRPVNTGDELRFLGWVTKNKGRIYFAEGEVINQKGEICASSTGKYIEAKPDLKSRLLESLE